MGPSATESNIVDRSPPWIGAVNSVHSGTESGTRPTRPPMTKRRKSVIFGRIWALPPGPPFP